jgi:hypothetical protein
MSTVLVTVYAPHGTADLELPTAVPIGEILPLLVETCVPEMSGGRWEDPAYWGLGPVAGPQPFSPTQTLADRGILDGATLAFQDINSWAQPPRPQAAARVEDGPQPEGGDSGGIGIRWNKDALLS